MTDPSADRQRRIFDAALQLVRILAEDQCGDCIVSWLLKQTGDGNTALLTIHADTCPTYQRLTEGNPP